MVAVSLLAVASPLAFAGTVGIGGSCSQNSDCDTAGGLACDPGSGTCVYDQGGTQTNPCAGKTCGSNQSCNNSTGACECNSGYTMNPITNECMSNNPGGGSGTGTGGTGTGGTGGDTGAGGAGGTGGTGGSGGTGGTGGTGGSGSGGGSGNCGAGYDFKNGICIPQTNTGWNNADTLPTLLQKIIKMLLQFAGAIAVVFIILGGFWYITSAGNGEQAEKGKNTLVNAVIGLVVVILSYTIVAVVAGTLNR